MQQRRLLLISGNFSPELNGIGKYNGEMIQWLATRGYDCTVVTTYPYYPQWKVQEPYRRCRFIYTRETLVNTGEGKITVYRCPQYVPGKPSGAQRMLQDFSFSLSAGWKVIQLLFHRRYDFVIVVAPSFQLGLLGVLYKKFRQTTFLYHIQDLQVDAAKDLGMIKAGWLLKALFATERFILQQADIVSSIAEGMIRKIKAKFNGEVLLFPNWVDITSFYPMDNRVALKEAFGFRGSDRIVLYSGALGEKQGLESILQAAKTLQTEQGWTFLICGTGPYRMRLQEQANAWRLSNVHFIPLQPEAKFNSFLNMADLHLVIQKSNAGDLVMPSKLTTIMAVGGLAIITANGGTGLHELVQLHRNGVLVNADDPDALTAAISRWGQEEATEICRNARRYAENHLAVDYIMSNFESEVNRRL
ncbi:WcaI family glycosyltransferase [Chitinophaga eiseniae]|uniref:WcaI family glycosyltransferase n=1 Tax=Chitinophaga eiseniae TaxID=634771 RepID=A0A847SGP7_9BACT|nr:WcaI family glycosyltransferase [Chitinophaga eiseniae]NLR80991.1 WcaI family glycosyltransferase [Chitinophaga eiseniae]